MALLVTPGPECLNDRFTVLYPLGQFSLALNALFPDDLHMPVFPRRRIMEHNLIVIPIDGPEVALAHLAFFCRPALMSGRVAPGNLTPRRSQIRT